MRQNIYLRALLSFLGAALVASVIVVAIGQHPQASTPVPVAAAAPANQPAEARPPVTLEEEPPPAVTGAEPPPTTRHTTESPRRSEVVPQTRKDSEPGAPAIKSEPAPWSEAANNVPPAPRAIEPERGPVSPAPSPEPPPPAPVINTPPPVRIVNSVVLGPGTPLQVRLDQTLSTKHNRSGQSFGGVLEAPVIVNGFVAAERGARVEGRIMRSEGTSRIKGLAHLTVVLTGLDAAGGQHLTLNSNPVEVEGRNIVGVQSLKTGASTSVGAVVGAVAGRTPGSALGSLVGGVIGTSGAILTGGKPAVLSTQQPVTFHLRDPVSITEGDAASVR